MYHNEDEVGRAIRESDIPREEIFVITKLYPNQFSDPETAIEDALGKLNIDYIDMMLLHHPGTDDVKAYKAMEKYVENGKIRSIGLSNWYVKELYEFLPQITIKPALVQNEIHPYYQENDVIPYIQSLGITVQGWYPLGGRGHTSELLGDETISAIADAHGKSSAQIMRFICIPIKFMPLLSMVYPSFHIMSVNIIKQPVSRIRTSAVLLHCLSAA